MLEKWHKEHAGPNLGQNLQSNAENHQELKEKSMNPSLSNRNPLGNPQNSVPTGNHVENYKYPNGAVYTGNFSII